MALNHKHCAPEQLKLASISENTIRSAAYSRRAPSPPDINVPMVVQMNEDQIIELLPSLDDVDPTQLTGNELHNLTQGNPQVARDRMHEWKYEARYKAQAILDFLYLGPTSIIRDVDFLEREGITMMLVVQDPSMKNIRPRSVQSAVQALGIQAEYVVSGSDEPIRGFSSTIHLINKHLLSVYHSHPKGRKDQGHVLMETCPARRGKVLLTCETGNDRAPVLAAAYIMAVFGKDMATTLQFVWCHRPSCSYDGHMKHALQSWEDIVRARSTVAKGARLLTQQTQNQDDAPKRLKRSLDSMMDVDSEDVGDGVPVTADGDRFSGRDPFVPFADVSSVGMMR